MATIKRRLNVSLPKDVDLALSRIAERDQVPQATKAADLLRLALEIEEDVIWDQLAKNRDTNKTKFVSHNKAWA